MAAAMPFVSIIGSLAGSLGGLFGKKDKPPEPPAPAPVPPPPAAPIPEPGMNAEEVVASEASRVRDAKRRQAAQGTTSLLESSVKSSRKKTLLGE